MLNLSKVTAWFRRMFSDDECDLSEEIYNDVIPSGVHHVNHSEYDL